MWLMKGNPPPNSVFRGKLFRYIVEGRIKMENAIYHIFLPCGDIGLKWANPS